MICEITIAIFATLVLADAGNTPGFVPDAREQTIALQAAQTADAPLRRRADSSGTGPQSGTVPVPSERSKRPVTSSYQPIQQDVFSVTYPWVLSFLLIVLGAAGILAARESVNHFRQASTDSGLPLVMIPSQNVNRPVAHMDLQPTAFEFSPFDSPARPDYSVPREMVSVSAPPEGTLLLLPGRFEIVKGDSRMKEIRFVKVPGIDVVTFGRHPGETDMHVRVDSPTVGRMHASMRWANRRWLIQNLSRTNPVVLNGEQLSVRGEQELRDGDQVEIGEVTFRFRSH